MMEIVVAFFGVFITAFVLSPVACYVGLVDEPDYRKQHIGVVPVVGGLSMFLVAALAALFLVPQSTEMTYLLAACALLTATGALDDRYHIRFQTRLLVQATAAALLVWGANTHIQAFGNLFSLGEVRLGWMAIPVTLFAIVGMINAFNMIDGMDGLSGGLSLITACALLYLIGAQIADEASTILLLMIGALSAFLIMNLHALPRWTPKIFMGDAGSMLIGFVLTAFLIRYSQDHKAIMMPVTALWLVAVPLMDIIATCVRRMRHRRSPFHPDRTHVHHILMRAGFNDRSTLLLILAFQAIAAGTGILIEKTGGSHLVSFAAFILLFIVYLQFIAHSFKFAKWVRNHITHPSK